MTRRQLSLNPPGVDCINASLLMRCYLIFDMGALFWLRIEGLDPLRQLGRGWRSHHQCGRVHGATRNISGISSSLGCQRVWLPKSFPMQKNCENTLFTGVLYLHLRRCLQLHGTARSVDLLLAWLSNLALYARLCLEVVGSAHDFS